MSVTYGCVSSQTNADQPTQALLDTRQLCLHKMRRCLQYTGAAGHSSMRSRAACACRPPHLVAAAGRELCAVGQPHLQLAAGAARDARLLLIAVAALCTNQRCHKKHFKAFKGWQANCKPPGAAHRQQRHSGIVEESSDRARLIPAQVLRIRVLAGGGAGEGGRAV